MANTLGATFDTRREAEMKVQRLVQQFGLDRAAIHVNAGGERNFAEFGANDVARGVGVSPDATVAGNGR